MPRIHRVETITSHVTRLLREADDFRSRAQLAKETGYTNSQLSAVLHGLRKYRVVDVVVNPDGTGWWFALPPDSDIRLRKIDEIVPAITRKRHRRSVLRKEK